MTCVAETPKRTRRYWKQSFPERNTDHDANLCSSMPPLDSSWPVRRQRWRADCAWPSLSSIAVKPPPNWKNFAASFSERLGDRLLTHLSPLTSHLSPSYQPFVCSTGF